MTVGSIGKIPAVTWNTNVGLDQIGVIARVSVAAVTDCDST
jgi:hypothetical protein